jgi:glycosyltransferase involved in cell wall biosynthesis
MRLVFVNRFYWPDEPATAQLLADLAEALARRGFAVTVIASRPARIATPRTETRAGVVIRRVRTTHGGCRVAARAVDFATFYLGAAWRLLRTVRRGDVVVLMTDPPLLGALAGPLIRMRGARAIHWVQDIYPEIAIALTSHRWLGTFRPLRNRTWKSAVACVVPGADMGAHLAAAGVPPEKIVVIPNWSPAGVLPPTGAQVDALRRAWGVTGKFVAMYSGNFGRVHDLEPLLDVAAAMQADPELVFVFVGDGAQRAALERIVRRRGLGNVHFRPFQPRAQLGVSLAVGDVHFVTLRPGCETLVFPSKLHGIAAAGRPAIFIGPRDSEPARLIENHGFGRAFTRNDTTAVAEALRGLRRDRGRRERMAAAALAFSRNDAAAAAARWAELLTAKIAPSVTPLPNPPA